MKSNWSTSDLYEAKLYNEDQACAFIKSLYLNEFGDEKNNNEWFRTELEKNFIDRNSDKLNFYICKYGLSAGEIIKDHNDNSQKSTLPYYEDNNYLAALNNKLYVQTLFWGQTNLIKRFIEDFPATKDCLISIFANPSFDRNTITNLIEKRTEIEKFSDPEFLNYFAKLVQDCPAIETEYDNVALDGWSEFSHRNLHYQFFDLLCDLEPTKELARPALQFAKLSMPIDSSKTNRFSQIIEKWQDSKFNEEPTFGKDYNLNFFYVRNSVATTYFNLNQRSQKSFYEVHKTDPAVRHAFYRTGTIESLLSVSSNKLDIPDFKSYASTKTKQVPVEVKNRLVKLQNKTASTLSSVEIIEQRILEYFCNDQNEFIEQLAYNAHFWYNEIASNIVHKLGWDLALDPGSHMDTVNIIRYSRRHFEKMQLSRESKNVSVDEKLDALEKELKSLSEAIMKPEATSRDECQKELKSIQKILYDYQNTLNEYKETSGQAIDKQFSKLFEDSDNFERLVLDRLQRLENGVAGEGSTLKRMMIFILLICGIAFYINNN